MKLLELFCGTKSIGKEFEKVGYEIISLDFEKRFDPTYVRDILTVPDNFFDDGDFDDIWASPPCNAFTVALIGRNWFHDHTPKNDLARNGLAILEKTVRIIQSCEKAAEKKGRKIRWWFENPRGKMRKMPIVQDFRRVTVTYCQYGDTRMKPTDIWTNTDWEPRPICSNGNPCHEAAPRGTRTGGTQGIKGSKDRAIIPAELCAEIAQYAIAHQDGSGFAVPTPTIVESREPDLFSDATAAQEAYLKARKHLFKMIEARSVGFTEEAQMVIDQFLTDVETCPDVANAMRSLLATKSHYRIVSGS